MPDKQPSSQCRLSHGVKTSSECVSVWLLTFLAETLEGQLQSGIFSVGMIVWFIEESGILSPDGWLRTTMVERRYFAGELSVSCA